MQEVGAGDAREENGVQAERGKRVGTFSSGGIEIGEVWAACGITHRWLAVPQTRASVSTAPKNYPGSS